MDLDSAVGTWFPTPTIIEPTDAIVRIDSSTICGTDLHILKGDVPETTPGTILGHEAVGTVVELGSAVTTLEVGDRVLVSCITACGRCRFCREGHYGLCTGGGGWIFGHLIDGLQAEYARVPFADTSVYKVPEGLSDEQVLFLADILPTAYEVGVLNGRVEPGDTVAVVGAGPIGLATVMTAMLHSPGRIVAIDLADARLEKAREFGADDTINNGQEDAIARVMDLTGGLGADVAIEAVGVPETFELCAELIRPGGRIANVGVHGHPATLHLERLWIRDVLITTGEPNGSIPVTGIRLSSDAEQWARWHAAGMRILVVEDEDAIAEPLVEGLRREGFEILRVASGQEALDAPLPDLVLLDLRLPDVDGLAVCRELRSRSSVPIIMITAKGEEVDKVVGLEVGADDYVVKPFGFRELLARIRAVTRRSSATPDPAVHSVGALTIDAPGRRAALDGLELELTPKEFDLLLLLVREAGTVVSKQQIFEDVWGSTWYGGTKTIDVHVASLRRKLGDPAWIETVRGVGLRLQPVP